MAYKLQKSQFEWPPFVSDESRRSKCKWLSVWLPWNMVQILLKYWNVKYYTISCWAFVIFLMLLWICGAAALIYRRRYSGGLADITLTGIRVPTSQDLHIICIIYFMRLACYVSYYPLSKTADSNQAIGTRISRVNIWTRIRSWIACQTKSFMRCRWHIFHRTNPTLTALASICVVWIYLHTAKRFYLWTVMSFYFSPIILVKWNSKQMD